MRNAEYRPAMFEEWIGSPGQIQLFNGKFMEGSCCYGNFVFYFSSSWILMFKFPNKKLLISF